MGGAPDLSPLRRRSRDTTGWLFGVATDFVVCGGCATVEDLRQVATEHLIDTRHRREMVIVPRDNARACEERAQRAEAGGGAVTAEVGFCRPLHGEVLTYGRDALRALR